MNEEELLEKNNIILSHNKLPKGMSTCENYGLSGNCGIKCPLFKNGTCEVYKDVAERIINNLQSKIDKAIEYIEENILDNKIEKVDWDYDECYYSDMPADRIKPLIDILKEAENVENN